MPGELSGKVALITGASSGIGEATAVAFARAGATVGLLGRSEQKLEELRANIVEAGGLAHVLVADVAKPNEVSAAVSRLIALAHGLDVVFANAGINGVWAPIAEIEPEEWQRTFDTNLHGTFYTIKYAVPHLKPGAAIVLCASVNGTRMFSLTGATAYACSKSAQATMAKMLAVELGRRKIRVNVVCPGYIETNISEETQTRHLENLQQPAKYPEGSIPLTGDTPGSPEQVADAVLFLATDRASHINGTELWIDGGQSLVEG